MDGQILLDPFYIDDNELAHTCPEEAFVLGVEWATMRLMIDADPQATMTIEIHRGNVKRIKALCNARGRVAEEIEVLDDTWVALEIYPPERNVLQFACR